jgi:hypothetical protein
MELGGFCPLEVFGIGRAKPSGSDEKPLDS